LTGALSVIKCYPNTKIYIFCPGGFATGGPEALHQLGAQLKLLGFDAYMHYYCTVPDAVDVVHKNYKKYNVPVAGEPENDSRHIIILPETYLTPIFDHRYYRTRKFIWWLSVANYYITQQYIIDSIKHKRFFKLRTYFANFRIASFSKLKRRKIQHISHSYYSQVHLSEHGLKSSGRISDYMNSAFFDSVDESTPKENIIIYNPVKNDEFLEQIMKLTPNLNWVPIKSMTPAEVAVLMNQAKLYVDFGYHPGKERMPREACIMRCCMIVGKSGSALYHEDMPIPDKYRFDKKTDLIPEIIVRINECLNDYDKLIADFNPYRETLYLEEQEFKNAVQELFVRA
jgi:hypothetical protein